MRKAFVAGNWKMNTDNHSGVELVKGIKDAAQANSSKVDVAVFPPFVYLQQVAKAAEAPIAVGSQDIYFEEKGAFTGEISSAMLKDVGCVYALCGHSERRHVIGETNEIVNKKVKASIDGGLLPVLCIGELIEERKAEKTFEVLTEQIKKGLAGLTAEKVSAVTLAYEPVWAIGTGLTATGEQAQEAHSFIRKLIAEIYDETIAENIRILYGGSAKPENTAELMAQKDIDGLLVGGASLKADSFSAMIAAAV
ncbi:MAG: triose-phosphate isomerase [Planctomycetes bacterium]|nr:triose-phosphate isomerase [Planctomycetota bacterium]